MTASTVAGTGIGTVSGADDDCHRYVVGAAPNASTRSISSDAKTVHRTLEFGSIGTATVCSCTDDVAKRYAARSDVRYVERDHVRRAIETVSAASERTATQVEPDPSEEQVVPWGIERLGVESLPDKTDSSRQASIAVLDTGIDPEHESLEVDDGISFVDCSEDGCDSDWEDDGLHGTHIAGTAAAVDNDVGVVGVTPNAELCAVKVLDGDGSGHDSEIAAAIEWCADEGIDVLTLSLGGPEPGPILEDAMEYAYENGVLVFAAAGNAGPDEGTVDYPAAYDSCIAVGATDSRDNVADFSARGDGIELVAPGVDIVSTTPGDDYEVMDGTSMAVPHVAGLAARLIGSGIAHADDTNDADDPGGVRGILRETAEDLGADEMEQGYGLVDAASAAEEIGTVATDAATKVRATTATLTGTLRSLEDADAADVFFHWRPAESDEWTETDPESVPEDEAFSAELTDLEPETAYEFRAAVDSPDANEIGETATFETGLDSLVVETGDASAIDHESVQCVGTLEGMGDADAVEVAFQWRDADDSSWTDADGEEREEIGEFDDELSGLDYETEYEVRAVATAGDETATGDAVSVETDPEPGLPEIEQFEIDDSSSQNFVGASVQWTVTDQDGDLVEITSELRYADGDEVLHSVTSELEGGEESGTHTLKNTDRLEGAGEEYEIATAVADGEGNVTDVSEQVTLDEKSPSPSIDRFEVTPTDFLGDPSAEVEWAVSDEGGELWELELELCLAGDDEVLDDASTMARGDEKSGSHRLTDGDTDGETEYEVTITVADYFEQVTTETTTITLGE
ncbi:serine protease [Natronococcus pandeyae]|uniref:Serine protease n=1 Tax=Natronococcus pandeyae TaxID=2055836 RepID=A0A8J8Q5M6_9EURY|nr:S8 family serine peptidase [Natronococcus pandeyae]TYL38983.1 serine protease [Natronococcus pandeyae]